MPMALRLTEDADQALADLAAAQGISKQEVAARAILEAAERRDHRRRVAQAAASNAERYADLLDRLRQ